MTNLAVKLKPNSNEMTLNNLKAFFITAFEENLPVALWHLPNEEKSFAITSFSGIKEEIVDFDQLKGFIVSAFYDKNDLVKYISADLILDNNGDYVTNSDNNLTEDFLSKYKNNLVVKKINWFTNSENKDTSSSKDDYVSLVKKSIEYIKIGELKKIVTSRTKVIDLQDNFDPIYFFERLVNKYPNAFISLISIPEVGTWIGASPEILLKIENNQLTTMALAGTQIYKGQELEEVEWGLKEKEEQLTVSEYIEEKFVNLSVKDFHKSIPTTIIAGNVLHIQTLFSYSSNNINDFSTKFISGFSPTPAVCGYPKDKSLNFLLKNESYNREFYSGYLGLINIFDKSNLFVNLRCMQIKNDKAVIYVGGGITADSVPEKEWYETELKSQTLLSVLE